MIPRKNKIKKRQARELSQVKIEEGKSRKIYLNEIREDKKIKLQRERERLKGEY